MATIGSLIIEIAGDNSRLRKAFRESEDLQKRYERGLVGARAQFAASATALRENLFSGALSPAQFTKQGATAARAYNVAVLSKIAELRGAGELTPRLHATLVNELREAGLDSSRSFAEGLASGLKTAGSALTGLGKRLTIGVTLPVAAEGVLAFKAASDAAEEANAFRVTFGPLADEVQRKLTQLHRIIPVTNTQLQNLAGNFGALLLPMGIAPQKAAAMSTRLVELAGDIQSLRNIPFAEVVQRLTSGLVGETEAVRRLGANIGEVALRQESLRLGYGKNITALSASQKATAVYNILLRDTALATGDAANTMDSAANQVRFMQRNFQELQVVIGTQLLPVLTPLVARFAAFLDGLKKANPENILFWAKMAAGAAILGPVITALGTVISLLGGMLTAMLRVRTFIIGAGGLQAALSAVPLALAGPAGWAVALGIATVALVTWLDRLAEGKTGVEALRSSLNSMTRDQLASEITRRGNAIGALQLQARNAPLVSADNTGNGAPVRDRASIRAQIQQESAELAILTTRWQELTKPEADSANIAARQLAVWKQMAAQSAAIANGTKIVDPKDAAAALEQHLSQLLQTRTALANAGENVHVLDRALFDTWTSATRQLVTHGNELDNVGLRLREIGTRARDALGISNLVIRNIRGTPTLPVEFARPGNLPFIPAPARVAGINSALFSEEMLAKIGATRAGIQSPKVDATGGKSVGELRFQLALTVASEAVHTFGTNVRNVIAAGAVAAFKSIVGQLNPFAQIIASINDAAAPLAPVMAQLGAVVARDLAPVFKAFEPVLRELIPVIDAVLRTVSPILVAIAPILHALIPILKALFPLFKQGAIVTTYLFQAFAIGASIFLRAVGNIVIGFGTIIKALAIAIDKLPFVSAKGAIDAAQGIIDFGRALLASSDEFKQSAEEMAKARAEIRDITFDETSASVSKLGEAAAETADALRNVPTWWKSNIAIWEATHPRGGGGPILPPIGPAVGDPVGIGGSRLTLPPSLTGGGGGGGGGGGESGGGDVMNVNIETLEINEQMRNGRVLFREMIAEAQRVSQATFGTTTRWAEIL